MGDETLTNGVSNEVDGEQEMKVYSNDKAIKDLMEAVRDYYLNDSL